MRRMFACAGRHFATSPHQPCHTNGMRVLVQSVGRKSSSKSIRSIIHVSPDGVDGGVVELSPSYVYMEGFVIMARWFSLVVSLQLLTVVSGCCCPNRFGCAGGACGATPFGGAPVYGNGVPTSYMAPGGTAYVIPQQATSQAYVTPSVETAAVPVEEGVLLGNAQPLSASNPIAPSYPVYPAGPISTAYHQPTGSLRTY